MRRTLAVCFAALVFVGTAISQQSSTAPAGKDDPKRAKVLEMIRLLHVDELGVDAMKRQMATTKKLLPIPPKAQDDFESMFLAEFTAENMREMIVPIYEANFTSDELDQIIAFYKTPIGQKLIVKLPEIAQQGYAAGGAKGREIGEKVGKVIEQKLRAGEYGPWTPPQQTPKPQQ